ncbi:MAG TPA: single-stranded-DNA-specific exonuclease RecJ [Gammaproteobacteria bacterium]|nr:single-stranded-DNA-specific exonuclease RecJ [Gammaproteobacteria bacterium]
MKKVIIRRPAGDSELILPDDVHPVLRRIYASRAVSHPRELDCSLRQLLPFTQLKGMDAAVAVLARALRDRQRILIVGDFDADGATATAVAVRALRAMGAAHVDFLVPNRFDYGYGLTPEIVVAAESLRPEVLVTVDNGISSLAGVAAARERGMAVVVTDHHLPGAALPEADAIVNPNQAGDSFPSKNLAGVGVIFYVMLALRAHLRDSGGFARAGITEPNLAALLDLVALGTVADVVPLDHNNRILVSQGLARIRAGQCCPGVQALLQVAGRPRERIGASDMGYMVGPRLNAAGRLEDMSIGIACLLSDDLTQARALAARLDALNRERRAIESEMRDEALAELSALALDEGAVLPTGLCLYQPHWHQGVVGLVASRLKDKLHRPVIAFAAAGEGELKGSARSVPGLHIRDALDAVAARHPGLLNKFGGHAMAAGLSLPMNQFEAFRVAFDAEVKRHLGKDDLHGVIHSDGELSPRELDIGFAETLRAAGPWGQGFPEPVFDGRFNVASRRIVGERHLKLALRLPELERSIDAIWFNAEDTIEADSVRLAYKLDVNEYRGERRAQLVVEHME